MLAFHKPFHRCSTAEPSCWLSYILIFAPRSFEHVLLAAYILAIFQFIFSTLDTRHSLKQSLSKYQIDHYQDQEYTRRVTRYNTLSTRYLVSPP